MSEQTQGTPRRSRWRVLWPGGWRSWVRLGALLAVALIALGVGSYMIMFEMPGKSWQGPLPPLTPEEAQIRDRLTEHVRVLAGEIGERGYWKMDKLHAAAGYIQSQLSGLGYAVSTQDVPTRGVVPVNIEAERKGTTRPEEIFIIGAHYDSVPDCPAANDNGSGVAMMLELAQLMKDRAPARTLRFVAFVNEEQFQSVEMGSLSYARRCRERHENVVGMISLETVGYYSDVKGSQKYPPPFDAFYPDTGNFIGFVGNVGSRDLIHRAIGSFRRHGRFPSEGTAAPEEVPGIGWSDHWAFWQQGYPGLMVTDTAPYRYPWYHDPGDTPDKLDYPRMARVTTGMAGVVADLSGVDENKN